jgi:hypothetical protein
VTDIARQLADALDRGELDVWDQPEVRVVEADALTAVTVAR